MKKNLKIFVIIMALIIIVFLLRFVIGGSEDSWICDKGEWVQHGMPGSPMPTSPCN